MSMRNDRPLKCRWFGAASKIALIVAVIMFSAAGWPTGSLDAFAQPSAPSETQFPPVAKEDLRYAGRGFGDWRRQLLTDLEPKTRIAAIEALLAFGKKGYQEESVAAIGQMLTAGSNEVEGSAFHALGELGSASVPVLIGALRDKKSSVRAGAAWTLARIGPAAQAALDPLRQAVQDEDRNVRYAAVQGLAKVGAGEKRLLPAFEHLARSADMQLRLAVLSGLSDAGANDSHFVPLFLRALEDDDWQVRSSAGTALIHWGPPSGEVVNGLMQLVREDIGRVRLGNQFYSTAGSVVLSLAREERNVATVAPLLVEAATIVLASPALSQESWVGELLAALVRIGPQAAPAAPALARFIAIGSPAESSLIVSAIDALAAIGEAAREAAPALEAWLSVRENANVDLGTIRKHAAKALRSINK